VFVVTEANKLQAVKVEKGQLYGDNVEILSGITKETRIVTDARGLKAEQEVTIK
jgi:multidrug efflux pump subunit AcrA (membrane-fusion protein)